MISVGGHVRSGSEYIPRWVIRPLHSMVDGLIQVRILLGWHAVTNSCRRISPRLFVCR